MTYVAGDTMNPFIGSTNGRKFRCRAPDLTGAYDDISPQGVTYKSFPVPGDSMKISWLSSRYSQGILTLVAGVFFLLAVVLPDWLEWFGVDWDHGDGALEWATPVALALVAVVLGVGAVRHWHFGGAKVIRSRT